MFLCSAHACDDPDPQCSRCALSQAQIPRCPRRDVALRLSSRRTAPGGRAADARRTARATGAPPRGNPHCLAGTGGPRRARRRVIVVDASALLEALLRTPATAAVEERPFDAGHTLHAPT